MKNPNEAWMKQRSFRRLLRANTKNGISSTPLNVETARFARMENGNDINTDIIISLTSYKERLKYVPEVVKSILANTVKPYKICLTLWGGDCQYITNELQRYIDSKVIELIVCEEDLRPHNKYYYTMQKYPSNPIITIDDDGIYPIDLISSLLNSYRKYPNCVSARRVHKKTYTGNTTNKYNKWIFQNKNITTPSSELVATGVGGVLYPPNILNVNDSWLNVVRKHMTCDDIVLHYYELIQNINIVYVPNRQCLPRTIRDVQKFALSTNENRNNNDVTIEDLFPKRIVKEIMVDKIDYDKPLKCKNKTHILVVDYKQLNHTKQIISDLKEQNVFFDLTIFEQDCEVETRRFLDKIQSSWNLDNTLNIIYNTVNAPLNHIWNWFYENTTNPYLAILNNDIRICDNFISDAEKIFELENNCGLVVHPTNRPEFTKLNTLKYEKVSTTPTIQGWDFIIRRDAYSVIPKELWLWRGDDYVTMTAYKSGWKQVYDVSSPIIHYHSVTVNSISKNIQKIIENDKKTWNKLGFKDNPFKDNKYTHRSFNGFYQLDKSKKKVKICYTAITGKYDNLKEPSVISNGWQYICFTDNTNIKSNVWEICPIPKDLNKFTNVKKQRLIKICPNKYLPQYDECIWVDGNITIQCDLNKFVRDNCNGDFCVPKHPQRNCIYEECDAVESYKKDTHEHIEIIRRKLKNEGFPKNLGLAETGLLYRRNTEVVNNINNEWGLQMINNQTHRDQLTFNYVLWKLKQDIFYLPSDIVRSGKLFKINIHNKK